MLGGELHQRSDAVGKRCGDDGGQNDALEPDDDDVCSPCSNGHERSNDVIVIVRSNPTSIDASRERLNLYSRLRCERSSILLQHEIAMEAHIPNTSAQNTINITTICCELRFNTPLLPILFENKKKSLCKKRQNTKYKITWCTSSLFIFIITIFTIINTITF